MSAAAQKDPTNAQLQAQVETLFRGETLRGLLLNVWGWATVGAIAWWVGVAAWLGALAVLAALVIGFVMHEREMRKRHEVVLAAERREPVPAPVG